VNPDELEENGSDDIAVVVFGVIAVFTTAVVAIFAGAVVIVDEFQNLDMAEAITILTRFGRNTKYILCGDSFQADIGNKTCINSALKQIDYYATD
jgi:phosphate starvation-inducible protein PhoH